MNRSHVLGALALAALAVAALIALPAGAQSPTTLTFKELEKGATFKVVDVPPKAKNERTPPSVGDTLIFTNPLSKTATNTAGKLHADCAVTKGGRTFESLVVLCDGAYAFENGTIYVSALAKLTDARTLGAVVGGTGDYAGAQGTFESRNVRGGETTTITLRP
jgi:hypothetical protein